MGLAAIEGFEQGWLSRNTLVTTVMSNMGLDIAMRRHGIDVIKTPVGDRYVVEAMKKEGYNLGGEQSGHLIFLDFNSTGDGLISALQFVSYTKRRNQPLSEIVSVVKKLPQVIQNVKIREKKPWTL